MVDLRFERIRVASAVLSQKPYAADRIVAIGEEKHDRVGTHLENLNKP